MPYFGKLHHVLFVGTDISEERIVSVMWVIRIGELGTTLAVTSNRSILQRNTVYCMVDVTHCSVTSALTRATLHYIPADDAL
jgi:hypothetical protein